VNDFSKAVGSLVLVVAGFVGASLLGPPDLAQRSIDRWLPPRSAIGDGLAPLPLGESQPISLTIPRIGGEPQASKVAEGALPPRTGHRDNLVRPAAVLAAVEDRASLGSAGASATPSEPPRWATWPSSGPTSAQQDGPDLASPARVADPWTVRPDVAQSTLASVAAASSQPTAGSRSGAIPESAHGASEWVTHYVTDGDTLEKIAERYLGDASRAAELVQANADWLKNPELLPIGRGVRVPSRSSRHFNESGDSGPADRITSMAPLADPLDTTAARAQLLRPMPAGLSRTTADRNPW
jgi:hypothetical protein